MEVKLNIDPNATPKYSSTKGEGRTGARKVTEYGNYFTRPIFKLTYFPYLNKVEKLGYPETIRSP